MAELVAPRPAMKTMHSVPSRSTTEKERMKMAYLLRPASACGGGTQGISGFLPKA